MASRHAYGDAVAWMKNSRRRFNKMAYARKGFGAALLAGLILMGTLGVITPDAFGAVGSRPLRTSWPKWVLLGMIGLCLLYTAVKWRYVRWALRRIRDPFVRPPAGDPRYEGAADALAASPAAYRTRFVLWWVWAPVGLAVLGTMFAFSVAYFVVDAILAGFEVGWETPVLAGGNLILGLLVLRLAASRLSTWRMAMAVNKSVSTGY